MGCSVQYPGKGAVKEVNARGMGEQDYWGLGSTVRSRNEAGLELPGEGGSTLSCFQPHIPYYSSTIMTLACTVDPPRYFLGIPTLQRNRSRNRLWWTLGVWSKSTGICKIWGWSLSKSDEAVTAVWNSASCSSRSAEVSAVSGVFLANSLPLPPANVFTWSMRDGD